MKYQINDSIVTHVPASCLVEDYQSLLRACQNEDWDAVCTVMECLAEVIDRYTEVPEALRIVPSPSSAIAMSCKSGIILGADGADLRCAAGKPVSKALLGGVCQCTGHCMDAHGCTPENGRIKLACGFLYDMAQKSMEDEELLQALDEAKG